MNPKFKLFTKIDGELAVFENTDDLAAHLVDSINAAITMVKTSLGKGHRTAVMALVPMPITQLELFEEGMLHENPDPSPTRA